MTGTESGTSGQPPAALFGAPPAGSGNPYKKRFLFTYVALGLVFLAATAGLAAYLLWHQFDTPWSSWRPASGDQATMATDIGGYVEGRYQYYPSKLAMTTIKPLAFPEQDPPISAIAVPTSAEKSANLHVLLTDNTLGYQICGTGGALPNVATPSTACAPLAATPSPMDVGRLIRREALETALYTFKYVKGVDSVVIFLPPTGSQTPPSLIFYKKSDLANQLAVPLDKTLTLADPPLSNSADITESATIDGLTLLNGFNYTFSDLQTATRMLVLSPVP